MSVSPSNPPKKFLKKGEGLKRFAAYNPPLPTTSKKVGQRRKTFVKFKLDTFYPDILNDESINLSTEIPKIAPPKIIHTPIKPSRQALGAYNYSDSRSSSVTSEPCPSTDDENDFKDLEEAATKSVFCERSNIEGQDTDNLHDRALTRKITSIRTNTQKMISFHGLRKSDVTTPPEKAAPVAPPNAPTRTGQLSKDVEPSKRYNLRGARKGADNMKLNDDVKIELKKNRRHLKAVVERHDRPNEEPPKLDDDVVKKGVPNMSESQISGNLDDLLNKIAKKKASLNDGGMSDIGDEDEPNENVDDMRNHNYQLFQPECHNPSSAQLDGCIKTLGKQIQQIQSTINELNDRVKKCECGRILGEESSVKPTKRTTRSRAANHTYKRPSANADNTTPRILSILMNEVAQLRASFDEMSLMR